jgi:hypothetical protein
LYRYCCIFFTTDIHLFKGEKTMSKADDTLFQIVGSAGKLPVLPHDSLARQLGMLFECRCMGLSVDEVAKKYSYSRQRYFQIQHAFLSGGTEALLP